MREILTKILDFLIPPRRNFAIVNNLDEKTIDLLPKANEVKDMRWIHPLFQYKDSRVKALVWELKYQRNTKLLEHIGQLLYEEIVALIGDLLMFESDAQFLLIPIPITTERRRERGYNQSELIAKEILNCDLPHILTYAPQWFQKIKETPRQSHSESREERKKNLHNCFEANPQVSGKYIILIDDVVTTGSTFSEARKTLLNTGARDVFAFTIAH